MADHPPPPPRLIDLHSATQILDQTTAAFSTRHHLRIFLLLSCLLFSLRVTVENFTHLLNTHLDNDPFIESLLRRTQLPPNLATSQPHRTHVGVLDHALFSGHDEFDHRFFENTSKPKPELNHTSNILDSFDPQLGFSNFVSDNGIVPIKIINNTNDTKLTESKTDLQFLISSDQESYTLLYLFVGIILSYGFMIFTCVWIHIWVHGVIFVLLVNHFLNNHTPLHNAFRKGANLGSRRLFWVMIWRWVVRVTMTQVLAFYFFGEVKDHYTLFKIFTRLMFMPFSARSIYTTHWFKDFDEEIFWFMVSWFLLDKVVSFVFSLSAWVAFGDPGLNVGEVMDGGCRLLSLRFEPAIGLKTLEELVCGLNARDILANLVGKVLASMIQTFLEVYFLVAWMMHYFAVKSIDAVANGEAFGNAQFQDMLRRDR